MSEIQKLDETFSNLTNTLNKFGHSLSCFNFSESPAFGIAQNIPNDHLFQINASLESYNDLICDGPIPGESENSQTERHLQKFLTKFGLYVNSSLLEDLQDGYLVEVYSRSHQQMYRSINFFKICSYDLGALTFVPWDKLFYRPEENTKEMFKTINSVLDNNLECMKSNIPVHFLTELCSDRKFGYKLIRVGSVFDQETGAPMGYLSVISVKEVLEAFRVLH